MHIDHVTIRTGDLRGAKTFFENVFELTEVERPQAIQRIPGHWLESEGRPVVHLIQSNWASEGHASEAIDHVGFRMEGYDRFRNHLEALGIGYSRMDLADIEERRLFLFAPGGPLLEVVFGEPVPADA